MIDGIKKKLRYNEFPQPEYLATRYPVLLCHGFGGLANAIQASLLHRVCMLYRNHCITSFAPTIVPYAGIETRAGAWIDNCDLILEATGSEKINLVAHSMGGLDMRHAITRMGLHNRVASLTTVATPHRGTSLAELALKTPEKIQDYFIDILDWLGDISYPDIKSDAQGALKQLTREYVQNTFNPETPDHPDVRYFSVSTACGKGTAHDINRLLYYFNSYIHENEGINDGYVGAESAVWGEHLFRSKLNHIEQIKINLPKKHEKDWENLWLGVIKNLIEKKL